MRHLKPEHPQEAGLENRLPDFSHIEGAELLANESRDLLHSQGFTDREIEEWAHTYIADEHSGDVTSFIKWIDDEEHHSRPSATSGSANA